MCCDTIGTKDKDDMNQKPLVILTGPTAVGKTELSVALAKRIHAEIISADSMQVYRHMDIGSAKITPEEMQGIPHHLIDELSPFEEFHVVRFQEMAKQRMEEIYARGNIPLIVGGTGFYIQALVYDIDFTEQEKDDAYRRQLAAEAASFGNEYLHQKLAKIDPASAKAIHPNNRKRVIRALEYFEKSGQPISDHNEEERSKESPYDFAYFVLSDERQRLYERIDRRVDEMLAHGLVDEVRALQKMGCTGDMVSMQGLGYKEILRYLNGELSYDEAVYILKRDTRHFAKRQLTWFKRERDVIWVNKPEWRYRETDILEYICTILHQRHIL